MQAMIITCLILATVAVACGAGTPAVTPVTPLERPDNLITQNDGHTVWLTWRGPSRADSFLVHYRKVGSETWQEKQVEREVAIFSSWSRTPNGR